MCEIIQGFLDVASEYSVYQLILKQGNRAQNFYLFIQPYDVGIKK